MKKAANSPNNHPAIKSYYNTLGSIEQHATNEGAVRFAFQSLLAEWGRPYKLAVIGEQPLDTARHTRIRVDGMLVDEYKIRRGYWEAKDSKDDLEVEIRAKIEKGYPLDNIIFEDTRQAVLYQNKQRIYTADLRQPDQLERLLREFVTYQPADIVEFHTAVNEFTERIPELAKALTELIDTAKKDNARFRTALLTFLELCRASLNKDTSPAQVEDMLKQHILTERIFRSIFQNPDFVNRNAVAIELEKLVKALTSQSFSRDAFLRGVDYFYRTIERQARDITDYQAKQDILNNLYERFFQAYLVKDADTHGIVYTPAPIVRFMVDSVDKALQEEFDLSLGAEGVHIIDPCVGTGTFIMQLLQKIPKSQLEHKYRHELHANEVLLLPYYIASQNIEHAYEERTGKYLPFEGICFADTLNLVDAMQMEMFAPENTERVKRQKDAPVMVVIGNPPYNAWQENENDNNKNRKYATVDNKVATTYAKASKATLKISLSDPYVKFFRWATDRLGERDGIVCFVSNNSFLNQFAFDGMRKHLLEDFDRIYTFDLGGNVRKNPKLSGTRHNVFGIQVGVCITLLVRNKAKAGERGLYYTRVDEFWTKFEKLAQLGTLGDYKSVNWQNLTPDAKNNWLNEGVQADFDTFLPMGTREAKAEKTHNVQAIFKTFSAGVFTGRDNWVYSYSAKTLEQNISKFIEEYNLYVIKWLHLAGKQTNVDDFTASGKDNIKWSRNLKRYLQRGKQVEFSPQSIRQAIYRPFTKKFLYFANQLVDEQGSFDTFFPNQPIEQENAIIWLKTGSEIPMFSLITHNLVDFLPQGGSRCFPFYTYAEDGTNRRENITDYALEKFRKQYQDATITKWDIFYYVYAVLHAPQYRTKYAENLKRDLPRIPFVPIEAWSAYVEAGKKLATLHRDYEQVKGYNLARKESESLLLDWKVDERGMRLSADKTNLRYNDYLTLIGIPPKVFEYKLGNRSALEWVIDQYRVSEDKRSGLRHDPNNPDDPQYIVNLVQKVIKVSLDTLTIIEGLPKVFPEQEQESA